MAPRRIAPPTTNHSIVNGAQPRAQHEPPDGQPSAVQSKRLKPSNPGLNSGRASRPSEKPTLDDNDLLQAGTLPDPIEGLVSMPRRPIPGMVTPREAWRELQELAKLPVTPTGFPLLDATLGGGLRPGQTYILAASTGQGKTSWVLQLAAQHLASGGSVAIWTVEMPPARLLARMLAQLTGRCWLDIEAMKLDDDTDEYARRVESLESGLLYYDGCNPEQFAQVAMRLPPDRPPLLILDYVQKLAGAEMGLREAVTAVSEEVRVLALKLSAPLIAVSSVSREAARRIRDQRNHHPGDLEDVAKESGGIDYDASTILVLGQDRSDEPEPEKTAVMSVAKNRFGRLQQIEWCFDGETGRFSELGPVEPKSKRDQRDFRNQIREAITDADGPISQRKIRDVLKCKSKRLGDELGLMVRDGELEHSRHGYTLGPTAPD